MCICSISDAYNDARDKVRYLEVLKQVFEQLHSNQTPMTAASNVLPSLSNAVKQMMGQSRVYAKSGFLGFLFMKVYTFLFKLINITRTHAHTHTQQHAHNRMFVYCIALFKCI